MAKEAKGQPFYSSEEERDAKTDETPKVFKVFLSEKCV